MRGTCTNPAALEGGESDLHSYFDTTGRNIVRPVSSKPWALPDTLISTPMVSTPGLFSARCLSNAYATYLEVTVHGNPRDRRADDIPFDGPAPSWGLHGIDVELVIGNLLDLVGQQAKAFLGSRGENSPPR